MLFPENQSDRENVSRKPSKGSQQDLPTDKSDAGLKQHSRAKKMLLAFTKDHRGKAVEVDGERETMRLLGPDGQELGLAESIDIIGRILASVHERDGEPLQGGAESTVKRIKVGYRTYRGDQNEATCRGVRPTGLFIETPHMLPVGTLLDIDIFPTNAQQEPCFAKGRVAWVCPNADQFSRSPGMGVEFTETLESFTTHLR